MEAGIATERIRHNGEERRQTAGSELAGMAVEREYRTAHAAQMIAPVMTKAEAAQLEETRRPVPAEAAENGMGV
jgi:hypothetical protein